MEKLVVIPTYNERENISKMISKVMSLEGGYHLLVVDDGSPDGTGAIVKERQAEFPDRLFLLERSGKLGLGTAYIEGFRWALARPYDAVFEMDCDFSHNPDDLLRLTAELEAGADVAVGSRYSKGVTVVNWPMSRLLMSYCASRYVRIVTGMPVCDATAGFVGYKREVLAAIDFDRIEMVGYGIPDRDEIYGLEDGIPYRRGADHLCRPDRRNLQDVGRYLRRSVLRGAGPAVSNDRPEEITVVALPGSVFLLCGR